MAQPTVAALLLPLAIAAAGSSVAGLRAPNRATQPALLPGPRPGFFLVASQQLLDPNFARSVVLVTETSEHGAAGLVINRPTELRLAALFPEVADLAARPDTLFLGGPVAREALQILVRAAQAPEGAHAVFADVFVSGSRALLEELASEQAAAERFHVYAGYAGWAPGQLEAEIARGAWHLLRAESAAIFERDPSSVWPELLRRSTAQLAARPGSAGVGESLAAP